MRTAFQALAVCIVLLDSGFAMAVESPLYSVVGQHNEFEVRRYDPYVVAETVVDAPAEDAGNLGFRILAAYIFGQNKVASKIAMTAPVVQAPVRIAMTAPVAQSANAGGYVVQFAMPREFTLDMLPEPIDPRVRLRLMPARNLAVSSYSGTWSRNRYEAHLNTLREALTLAKLTWRGEPIWARYDPPWTLWFLRRNEIWLEVD